MPRNISVKHITTNYSVTLDRYPDRCGICHKNIDPTFITGVFVRGDSDSFDLETTFQCTNSDCNKLIIGVYKREIATSKKFLLESTEPVKPVPREFDEEIETISNNFTTIYNQAYFADQFDLKLISGIGYRKALEFLIKDYLIYLEAEEEEKLLKTPLSQCINKLENHNIKEISKRATWLGNDEAHYQRKWEDKDINDLKKLIDITVHFISMEVAAKRYLSEMN